MKFCQHLSVERELHRVDITVALISLVLMCNCILAQKPVERSRGANYRSATLVPDGLLRFPSALARDRNKMLYVADTGNSVVRMVTPNGDVTIVAGTLGHSIISPTTTTSKGISPSARCSSLRGLGCPATMTILNEPTGLAVDRNGSLFISQAGSGSIFRINLKTKIAYGFFSSDPKSGQALRRPMGIALDADDNLIVADSQNNVIRKIAPHNPTEKGKWMTTIAGTGAKKGDCGTSGSAAVMTQLSSPEDVTLDQEGNIYVADTGCRVIRKIDKQGIMTTIVGTGAGPGNAGLESRPFSGRKGPALSMNLGTPNNVKSDAAGNLFISDKDFSLVWYYNATDKTLEALAGLPPDKKEMGHVCRARTTPEGDGCPGRATFLNMPSGVEFDPKGNIYIVEHSGSLNGAHPFRIRVLRPIKQTKEVAVHAVDWSHQ